MIHKNRYDSCIRNFFICSFVAIGFLVSMIGNAFAVGADDKGGVPSIYLCTKDLDNSPSSLSPTPQDRSKELRIKNSVCNASSLAYDIYNSTNGDYVFIPYDNGSECHYFLRHCFLVQAENLGEITIGGKKLLNLKYLNSRGFGADEFGRAVVYAEGIFFNDQYKNQIISCKLVFDKSNLTDEDLKKYEGVSGAMDYKWAEFMVAMRKEIKYGYDPSLHNCCTVVYKVLENINRDIKEIADPSEINYGIGVVFTGIGGAIYASVASEVSKMGDSSQNLSDNVVDETEERTEESNEEEIEQGQDQDYDEL